MKTPGLEKETPKNLKKGTSFVNQECAANEGMCAQLTRKLSFFSCFLFCMYLCVCGDDF